MLYLTQEGTFFSFFQTSVVREIWKEFFTFLSTQKDLSPYAAPVPPFKERLLFPWLRCLLGASPGQAVVAEGCVLGSLQGFASGKFLCGDHPPFTHT